MRHPRSGLAAVLCAIALAACGGSSGKSAAPTTLSTTTTAAPTLTDAETAWCSDSAHALEPVKTAERLGLTPVKTLSQSAFPAKPNDPDPQAVYDVNGFTEAVRNAAVLYWPHYNIPPTDSAGFLFLLHLDTQLHPGAKDETFSFYSEPDKVRACKAAFAAR